MLRSPYCVCGFQLRSVAIRSPILQVISCFTYAADAADKVSPYWLRTLSVLPPLASVLCARRILSPTTKLLYGSPPSLRREYGESTDREYGSLNLFASFRLCCSSRSHNFYRASERINAAEQGEKFEACCCATATNAPPLLLGRPFVKRFALCYRTVVLSVCLPLLSVTLVCYGQTVGWIKMKLGMEVGLDPGHIVLDGDPAFFRLSIHTLVAKIQPDKGVRWCRDGDFWRHFCILYFQRAACSTFQTCILNLH